jgi:hypothetical protein
VLAHRGPGDVVESLGDLTGREVAVGDQPKDRPASGVGQRADRRVDVVSGHGTAFGS